MVYVKLEFSPPYRNRHPRRLMSSLDRTIPAAVLQIGSRLSLRKLTVSSRNRWLAVSDLRSSPDSVVHAKENLPVVNVHRSLSDRGSRVEDCASSRNKLIIIVIEIFLVARFGRSTTIRAAYLSVDELWRSPRETWTPLSTGRPLLLFINLRWPLNILAQDVVQPRHEANVHRCK